MCCRVYMLYALKTGNFSKTAIFLKIGSLLRYMIIRPAQETDYEQLVKLYRKFFSTHNVFQRTVDSNQWWQELKKHTDLPKQE